MNNIQYMMARIIYPNEGYAVQASSYGLLIYIQQNNYKDSVAIVKFLHSVRNTIGGFGGTQVDNNFTDFNITQYQYIWWLLKIIFILS